MDCLLPLGPVMRFCQIGQVGASSRVNRPGCSSAPRMIPTAKKTKLIVLSSVPLRLCWATSDHYSTSQMTQDGQRLLTVAQAAQRYAVSEQTIRRWVARGALPSVSMGRVVRIPIRAADQRMGVDL